MKTSEYALIVFNAMNTRDLPNLKMLHQKKDICAIWTNKGETSRGEIYENSGVTIFNVKNGLITFISDYFKDTSFTNF